MNKLLNDLNLEIVTFDEALKINGGGIWEDFWGWLGRSHGRSICSIDTEADYEAAMERWRRGSMI